MQKSKLVLKKFDLNIISHRGYWKNINEKNSLLAFERSLSLNFGIEVDIRDYKSKIVISHDLPNINSPKLSELLDIYSREKNKPFIALNIKSDGLQQDLKTALDKYKINNYFVFDSSVPDAINFIKSGMKTFTRQSEYENSPAFYELAEGVWLDEFHSSWIDEETLNFHYNNGKKVCIVSPELHGRDMEIGWKTYKKIFFKNPKINISLCTDYPLEARKYFGQ